MLDPVLLVETGQVRGPCAPAPAHALCLRSGSSAGAAHALHLLSLPSPSPALQSYERSTLEMWFQQCREQERPCTDPLTRKVLRHTTVSLFCSG